MIIPLKILPALLVIAGAYAIFFEGEVELWSVAATVIGAIWSYYWYFKKD